MCPLRHTPASSDAYLGGQWASGLETRTEDRFELGHPVVFVELGEDLVGGRCGICSALDDGADGAGCAIRMCGNGVLGEFVQMEDLDTCRSECRQGEIPAVRWHDLRHFYASACASAGIPIERVAKYMGHADIGTMYKHYLHLFGDDHTDDMGRLAAVASRPAIKPIPQIGAGTHALLGGVLEGIG